MATTLVYTGKKRVAKVVEAAKTTLVKIREMLGGVSDRLPVL